MFLQKSSWKFSVDNSAIPLRDAIRKMFLTNYNDEFYHVVSCYLEDGITIF